MRCGTRRVLASFLPTASWQNGKAESPATAELTYYLSELEHSNILISFTFGHRYLYGRDQSVKSPIPEPIRFTIIFYHHGPRTSRHL